MTLTTRPSQSREFFSQAKLGGRQKLSLGVTYCLNGLNDDIWPTLWPLFRIESDGNERACVSV